MADNAASQEPAAAAGKGETAQAGPAEDKHEAARPGQDGVVTIRWDLANMGVKAFKAKFTSAISSPLAEVVKNFNANKRALSPLPDNDPSLLLPAPLQATIMGLMTCLGDACSDMLSTKEKQEELGLNAHLDSDYGTIKVMFMAVQSVKAFRECLLRIVNHKDIPMDKFQFKPYSEIAAIFKGPSFAPQLQICRLAQPGLSFPLLISWRIPELEPTACADTFLRPILIWHLSSTKQQTLLPEAFTQALLTEPSLKPYLKKCCQVCGESKVGKLQQCSRCKVAHYCGAAHQTEHWPKHKADCKRMRALKAPP
eukprot:g11399.t1